MKKQKSKADPTLPQDDKNIQGYIVSNTDIDETYLTDVLSDERKKKARKAKLKALVHAALTTHGKIETGKLDDTHLVKKHEKIEETILTWMEQDEKEEELAKKKRNGTRKTSGSYNDYKRNRGRKEELDDPEPVEDEKDSSVEDSDNEDE